MKKQVKKQTRQPKEEVRKDNGRKLLSEKKKVERKTEPSVRGGTQYIIGASPADIPYDGQCRGEKLPVKTEKKVTSIYVPVVSATGTPLMPCNPARARELIRKGKAVRRFSNSIFYIKLKDREEGKVQKVACGIDPGSKREGFTVKSENRTFINILSETISGGKGGVNIISKSLEHRNDYRHFRRYRKTPCRKCKKNRKRHKEVWLPPSIRTRFEYKLRICKILTKLYPISIFVVEDICAETKEGHRQWNASFSPLEIGKVWFNKQMNKIKTTKLMRGYQTAAIREELGLIKTKEKLSDVFEAHNVDSWVLANSEFDIQKEPDNTKIYRFVSMIVHRRQLHVFNPSKNGKRRRYGGTVSLGVPKFTVCRYKNEYITIGGNYDGKFSVHDLKTNERISMTAKRKELELFNYIQRWRVTQI